MVIEHESLLVCVTVKLVCQYLQFITAKDVYIDQETEIAHIKQGHNQNKRTVAILSSIRDILIYMKSFYGIFTVFLLPVQNYPTPS